MLRFASKLHRQPHQIACPHRSRPLSRVNRMWARRQFRYSSASLLSLRHLTQFEQASAGTKRRRTPATRLTSAPSSAPSEHKALTRSFFHSQRKQGTLDKPKRAPVSPSNAALRFLPPMTKRNDLGSATNILRPRPPPSVPPSGRAQATAKPSSTRWYRG